MKDITPPLDNHKPASASSTSAVDRLKEQFAESGLLLSPRGRVIRDARLHGKTCAQCSRPFADGEAVCRLRLSHAVVREILISF